MEILNNLEILEKYEIHCVWVFMFDTKNSKINDTGFEFKFPLELMN